MGPMGLLLESSRLFRLHLLLIGLLVGAHFAVVAVRLTTGHANLHGLTPLFDLDVEANVPTLVSAVALLGAASLFWATGSATHRHGRAYAKHWRGLAVVFVLLALDPVAKRHLVGAGVVFLAGAVGLEMVGGLIASAETPTEAAFVAAVTCEETLEMVGVALLVRGLVAYNERHFGLQAQGEALAVLAAPPARASREAWLTPDEALLILELRAQSEAALQRPARPPVKAGRSPERRRAMGEAGA